MNKIFFLLILLSANFTFLQRLPINLFNKTHFTCDDGRKFFHFSKLNDDYCDCSDGTDESSRHINIKLII
jgi:hypothetical protein